MDNHDHPLHLFCAALAAIVDQVELSHPARRTTFKDRAARVVSTLAIGWLWPWAIDTEVRKHRQHRPTA